MADIYTFFEEGIKSYIEESFKKYNKFDEIIIDKNYDNKLLHPLFINNITLYKNLIQKNKLKGEIWFLIVEKMEKKMNEMLSNLNKSLDNRKSKVSKYKKKMIKCNEIKKQYKEQMKELSDEINESDSLISNDKNNEKEDNNNENINNSKNKNNEKVKEIDDLKDIKGDNYYAKSKGELLNKLTAIRQKREEEKQNFDKFEMHYYYHKKLMKLGEINILKLKILQITITILIREINPDINNIIKNNYDKEKNYELINDYMIDFVDKCEKIKDQTQIQYTIFIKTFVIQLVTIINKQGYKDINKFFLNKLLIVINNIKKHYSNSYISDLIKYIEKLISNPDTFLCRNAFTILKNASFKKIKPRSRNNSFDKNDPLYNNNTNNNKNEKNRKIDEFMKKEEKESDSESEDFQKKLSSIISFKNSSTQLLNLNNNNNNGCVPFSQSSAISNNSNLLNSSRISLDDSMSIQGGMYRSGSYSELLGINSRLASQLPCVRNTKKEKEKKILEKFRKKIRIKRDNKFNTNINRKNSNENLDNIFGKEIRKIVNHNFYNNNTSTYDKENKNTTATENKKNSDEDDKNNNNNINKNSNILATKTPIKNGSENNNDIKDKIIDINNLKGNEIKKNLQILFNQQTDK